MTQPYEVAAASAKEGLFGSLKVANFRLYIAGHFISMIGVWMQIVALSWLVWRLTGSADWLGLVGFGSHVLTFALGLVGGAIADRLFRRNLILITQTLQMMQATLLAILTIIGIITPELIIGLVLFIGAISAFDFPARQSFITDIVGKEQVDNAVALGSSAVHAARVIGPSIAGILIAWWGEGICFIINAATFLALIGAILMMDKHFLIEQHRHDLPMHKSIHEGVKIAWQSDHLRYPLILLSLISFCLLPYYILIPIFVDKTYGRGPELYGFLMAVSAVGSLCGSLIMAKSNGTNRIQKNIFLASLGFSISIIAFSWMPTYEMGMPAMFFIGLFALITLASINAWLQRESPDHARGRIMSLYTMLFFGVVPFGSLIAGFAAERFGASMTLSAGGMFGVLASLWFVRSGKWKLLNKNNIL